MKNKVHSALFRTPGRWTGNNFVFKGGPGLPSRHLLLALQSQVVIFSLFPEPFAYLLVDDDESLVVAVAHLLFQLDDFHAPGVDESPLSLNQLLPL